jgi:PAS domain S-box-containing protein
MSRDIVNAGLDELIAHLPVAVYRTTADGRIVAGNQALVSLLGASSLEQLAEVDVASLYVDASRRDDVVARFSAGTAVAPEDIELMTLDGRRIWARASSRAVVDEEGDGILFIEGVLQDVTANRETRMELIRTNELLDTLTKMQNAYITGVDAGPLFDDLLDDLLAYTESEYGFIAQVLHSEDGSPFLRSYAMSNIAWNEATRRLFAEHGPRGMEFHKLDTLFGYAVTEGVAVIANDPANDPRSSGRPDGHPPLNCFLGLPVAKGDHMLGLIALANRPRGYDESLVARLQPLVATVGSMIEAIRSDEARRAAEQRERGRKLLYGAVVEHAAEAVIAFRDDGTIEAFNPAAERMTGYSEAEMVGADIRLLIPTDRVPEYVEAMDRAINDRSTSELVVIDRHGAEIPVELSFGRADLGDRPLTTAIVRNIAERKAVEDALRQAKDAAERMSRTKDEFLAGMSHELRTPLNAVIGLSTVLGREVHGQLSDKQHEYVLQIEQSGRHLLELINDILDLAKIEADQMSAELEVFDPGPVITAGVDVVRESALQKQLRVTIELPPSSTRVLGDPLRTKQILLNLLSNAVKFTDAGGAIGLEATVDEDRIRITVWDTGIGIPSDRLGEIFHPFAQLDSSLARSRQGTGLGLALSAKFATIQDGELTVASDVGRGSRFTLSLPLARDTVEREAGSRALTESAGTRPAPGLRVLLVEDNDVNRLMVRDYLEAHGVQVEVAVDGDEAVAKTRSWSPDVVLMDVQLPRRDGLSATRELKADPETAFIPIIALTALAMKGDAERCLEAGCDGYLSKPCDPAGVLAAVTRAAIERAA